MKIFLATEMANLKYHFVVKQTDDVIEKVLDLGFLRWMYLLQLLQSEKQIKNAT